MSVPLEGSVAITEANTNKSRTDMSRQRILHLHPYLYPGTDCWVFDDERTRLKEEAFVEGTSEIIL
jgi:hypothetical protein